MKKVIHITLAAVMVVGLLFLSGCDPTKTGGGGYQQPYNPGNGQYK